MLFSCYMPSSLHLESFKLTVLYMPRTMKLAVIYFSDHLHITISQLYWALQAGRWRVRFPVWVSGNFHWLNPSGRIMALGSTQPLTNEYQVYLQGGAVRGQHYHLYWNHKMVTHKSTLSTSSSCYRLQPTKSRRNISDWLICNQFRQHLSHSILKVVKD
jgi:hypothetical protein